MSRFLFTLIMPVYNGASFLKILTPQLIELANTENVEFIFVDSSSSDESVELLGLVPNARIISIPKNEFDHGGTRTFAAKQASSDLILFMTQDCLPVSLDSYTFLAKKLSDNKKLSAAYSRQIPHENASFFGSTLRAFNYPDKSYVRSLEDKSNYGVKTPFLSNSFCMYKKEFLAEIGYFKDNLILGEDTYAGALMLMKGHDLAYCAESVVRHSHDYTPVQEFKRYFDIGVFHRSENWIVKEFGSTQGEGIRFIKFEFREIIVNRKYLQLFTFFIRNASKYLGYHLGYRYHLFPRFICPMMSMHSRWWNKQKDKHEK